MPFDELALVTRSIRSAHESGQSVAVVGWNSHNHDDMTRGLPEEKFVFYERPPKIMPKKVGYAMLTRFVSHPKVSQMDKQNAKLSHTLTPGVIKRAIRKAGCMLVAETDNTERETMKEADTPVIDPTTELPEPGYEAHDANPQPVERQTFLPETVAHLSNDPRIKAFAQEFVELSEKSLSRSLSAQKTNSLIGGHFGKDSPRSFVNGVKALLTPVIREGGVKISGYEASEKIIYLALIAMEESTPAVATQIDTSSQATPNEPEDPAEKARWLVGRIPELLRRKEILAKERAATISRIDKESAELGRELSRCQRAEQMLAELKNL